MTPNASINVSVSNHYRESMYNSVIVSQELLGEGVEIVVRKPLFARIRQSDGYTSWVSSDQVVEDFSENHLKTFVSVNRYHAQKTHS